MTNLFVSKPRRRADRVAHRKLATSYLRGREARVCKQVSLINSS